MLMSASTPWTPPASAPGRVRTNAWQTSSLRRADSTPIRGEFRRRRWETSWQPRTNGPCSRWPLLTGGQAISETNNLALGIEKADEDLTKPRPPLYSPKNGDYDGRFREITVKVLRSHGDLRARKGYIAVKTRTSGLARSRLRRPGPGSAGSRSQGRSVSDPRPGPRDSLGNDGTVAAVLAEFRDGELSR